MQHSDAELKDKCQALLGNYLKLKRRERDLTQEEVGINVGYSPHTAKQAISQIERGVTWVPGKKMSEFVNFLELDKSFFSLLSYYYSIKNFSKTQEMLLNIQAKAIQNMSGNSGNILQKASISSAPAQTNSEDELERYLAKLKDLHAKNLIDDEDYKEAKREALKKFM
ncbi:MAG TPA: hypothetical protein ENJ82_11305 [Bacteroidetes bacterium]|nr:hypothetical protein [Bacteroidota bacterium]